MMETVYYDSSSNYQHQHQVPLNSLKRKMTLELNNSDLSKYKKSKLTSLQTPIFQNEVLASPDLQMCKLGSPDLENLLQGMQGINTPNFCFPKSVLMSEDGGIVEYDTSGFDDALISLRKQNQLSNSQNYAPSTTVVTTTANTLPIQVQQHQQQQQQQIQQSYAMYAPSESNSGDDSSLLSESSSAYGSIGETSIPSGFGKMNQDPNSHNHTGTSPPISPVDMESQERIKLERKRQRNRLAASKCRKRKLEKISILEDKVKKLKKDNGELNVVLEKLQKTVGELKGQVMKHVQSGCQMEIMMAPGSAY